MLPFLAQIAFPISSLQKWNFLFLTVNIDIFYFIINRLVKKQYGNFF